VKKLTGDVLGNLKAQRINVVNAVRRAAEPLRQRRGQELDR
jgi:hypothetical protein